MMPPGTAMRGMAPPGTAGMMPPGTAMRGMAPPGTAGLAIPGTGMAPPGTGMAGGMMGSVLQQGLKVDDRPVTQQGMGGMKTAGQGPGRQIFDRSYYIGQLRAKQSELNQEIERIHQKWDGLQTDHASFFKLAQRQQTLEDEVKRLQGDLGNYNLMVDKSHTTSDPEEVEKEYRALKAMNEGETKKIDAIITDRSEIERRSRDIDASIKKHQEAVQKKMDELPDEKRELWFQLQEEDRQLTSEITAKQTEVDNCYQEVMTQEDVLRRDPMKKQALELERAVQLKEVEKEELEKATAHLRLSFPEQKKLLLDQVKKDNEEMRKIEEEMKDLKEEVSEKRDRLHEMDTDLAENQGGGKEDQQKKMMDFYEKMQLELGEFAAVKQQEEADIAKAQTTTVDLLEYVSRMESRSANMPSAEQHNALKSELAFNQEELERNQLTVDKMEQELHKVRDESEKLQGIDEKIETEMAQLVTRKSEMMAEMEDFDDMDALEHKLEGDKRVRARLTFELNLAIPRLLGVSLAEVASVFVRSGWWRRSRSCCGNWRRWARSCRWPSPSTRRSRSSSRATRRTRSSRSRRRSSPRRSRPSTSSKTVRCFCTRGRCSRA